MKKIYGFFLFAVVFFVACSDKGKEYIPPTKGCRTVLVYMAVDNNLTKYARADVEEMIQGMRSVSGTLIVYMDPNDDVPQLFKIEPNGTKTVIETYAKENSASPEVLSRVFNRTVALYPAESYGLVLSSHGNGWRPASSTVKSRSALDEELDRKDPNAFPTKYFGEDSPARGYFEIPDLAQVLPKNRGLDFLLFDACLMGSIEVLYDLRNAAQYIIASPSEVLVEGFPYKEMMPMLFEKTPPLEQVCRQFITSYRNSSKPWASVALVSTAELEALAGSVSALYANVAPGVVDMSKVQYLEDLNTHIYYDLNSYLSQIAGDAGAYAAFQQQLRKTVLYSEATDYVYSASYGENNHQVKINSYCGLSTYVPRAIPFLNALNEAYAETAWVKRVGITF